MTLLVMMMTTATAWAAQPDSYLDACTGERGYIHLEGWAYDPDAPSQSIEVFMYVYTDAACTSQFYFCEFTAGVPRADVNSAKGITGDHGFNIDINIYPPGVYWVKLFAVDTNGDGDSQIGNTTKVTVTGYGRPIGSLEVCTGGEELIHIEGWAYDPDASSQSIDVHAYVYTDEGCTSQYGDVHVLTANVSRADVNSSKGITGNHGFNADIAIAAGNYWVKVIAIDTNGDEDTQIGSTTAVTVTVDYPSWVRSGDAWNEETKTLTVNTVGTVVAMAYRGQTEIEHVIIGSSVTVIGGYAFWQCSNLQSVTYEEGSQLTDIWDGAFAKCTSLTSFTIPAGVTVIQSGIFVGCTNLTTIVVDEGNPNYKSEDGLLLTKDGSTLLFCPFNRAAGHYTIPNGVSFVSPEAFLNCTTLTDITLPASVTTIQGYAFYGCSNLKTVSFAEGSQLETIAAYAFKECSSLTTFNFAENTPLSTIWTQAFSGCTSLESIVLPDHVGEIRERAFEGCTSLTNIHIPASLTTIGSDAFKGCTSLASFTVDDASTTYASYDGVLTNKEGTSLVCYPLGRTAASYTVPEGMTVIAPYTFSGCTALETVILPTSLTIIPDNAFEGCTGLTSITIPPNVTTLGRPFSGCSSLSTVIALPEEPGGHSNTFDNINSNCQFYVRSASYKTHNVYSAYSNNMTVISVLNTATGATATASAEPVITYDGTAYYAAGTTFTLSHADAPETSTGYEAPFQNYVVTNKSGEDIAATVLSGETLTLPESDVTIRARFTPIVYNITYDLDGGTADLVNPETYTIESNITLNAPIRDGFYFVGWTGTGLTEPTRRVTIPSGSTGDRAYTATWNRIPYIDADGIVRECGAKRIANTGSSQEFDDESVEEAWYYVDGNEEIQGSLLFKAKNTHLILFDDAAITLYSENYNITASSLTIYGQVKSTGQLMLRNHEIVTCSGIIANNLTINGGKVSISAYSDDGADEYNGLAIYSKNNLTINGGYLLAYTADTFDKAIDKAIFVGGNITLGWHLPTDGVFSWHYQYGGDFIVKQGKSFVNSWNQILTGTTIGGVLSTKINQHRLSPCYAVRFGANGGNFSDKSYVLLATKFDSNGDAHISAPTTNPTRAGYAFSGWKLGEADFDFSSAVTSNLTLTASWTSLSSVTIADDADNTSIIENNDGLEVNVTLQGRTFYRDGDWNTLCLPFDVNSFTGTPLADATVKAFNPATSNLDANGMLTLNFDDATTIEAGKPYLVKWQLADLLIKTAADWNSFAESVNNGNTYAGKTVRLMNNISVSTMVGTDSHPFSGTFDGGGHTLNVTINAGSTTYVAPFHTIGGGATIKDLTVTGNVTGGMHCAGLVGHVEGSGVDNYIWLCDVRTNINCRSTHCGGVMGHAGTSTTFIMDTRFGGSITGENLTNIGVIWGWSDGDAYIDACLAAGAYCECEGLDMARDANHGALHGSVGYKTQNFGNKGTYTTATGNELASLLGKYWTVSNGVVVPIIDPDTPAEVISNPVFMSASVDATQPTAVTSTDGAVSFVGSYSPVSISGEDRSKLFVGAQSTLYYPNGAMTIGSCRAYFQLGNGITVGDGPNAIQGFRLNFVGGDATGFDDQIVNSKSSNSKWYDLSGRRIDGVPTAKGIYIKDSKKIVIK